jgi:hypothetical protein
MGSTRAALLAAIQHANAPVLTNNKVVPREWLSVRYGQRVISSKRSRSRKVFSSLNEEHRNREFKAEIL